MPQASEIKRFPIVPPGAGGQRSFVEIAANGRNEPILLKNTDGQKFAFGFGKPFSKRGIIPTALVVDRFGPLSGSD